MQKDNNLFSARISLDDLNVCFYFAITDSYEGSKTIAHKHAWHEIHIARKGPSIIKVGENKYILNSKQALLMQPQIYHTTYTDLSSYDTFAIGFELTKNNKPAVENMYERMTKLFRNEYCIFIDNTEDLIDLYNEMIINIEKGEETSSCRIRNILTMFLFKLSDKLKPEQAVTNKKYISQMDSVDKRNYLLDLLTSADTGNISLSDLSQSIFLTPKQTNRIFKQRYNKTYKQKQIELRIENAKKLLLETSDSVDKIALNVGYTNITGFYKAFKRIVGLTPREYRSKHITKERSI